MAIPRNLIPCKTEKVCDDADATVYPIMKHLVEVEKLSEHKAGDETEKIYDGKVKSDQARMIYRRRKPGTRVPKHKPARKHTKKEVKIQLEQIRTAITSDDIADSDLKPVLDAVSMKLAAGKISTKVTARVAGAHRVSEKKRNPPPEKPKKSLVERVTNSFHFVATHMDAVLGKGKDALSVKDRRMLDKEVRRLLPYFLRTLLHMGVDLDNVLKEALNEFKREINQDGKNRKNYKRLEE